VQIRKFGVYISEGIEANNLLLSGLANMLQASTEVIVLVNYDSHVMDNLLNKLNIPKKNIASLELQKQTRSRLENFFFSVRRARLRIKGITPFLWLGNTVQNKRAKDYLIGNYFFYYLFRLLTFNKNESHYFNTGLADFIRKNNLTDIVMQSYSSRDCMSMAITAKKLGCKVWIFNWGWKDFYGNEFIPFIPNGFFTLSAKLKSLYLQFNSHLISANVYDFGSPGYDSLFNYKPRYEKTFYSQKYGFSLDKPIVLYTLVNPKVYADEDQIIDKVIESMRLDGLGVTVLLKPNPMDNDCTRFHRLRDKYSDVIILDNLWLYDKRHNFNLITLEARTEWLDLLYYCDMTMNIPSTVTLESLIINKPVINIGFGYKKEHDAKILVFANAPYYSNLFNRNDVFLAKNFDEVNVLINKVLDKPNRDIMDLGDFITVSNKATMNAVRTILEG